MRSLICNAPTPFNPETTKAINAAAKWSQVNVDNPCPAITYPDGFRRAIIRARSRRGRKQVRYFVNGVMVWADVPAGSIISY